MNKADGAFVNELEHIVGKDRVRSDTRECKLYSKDIGVMPKLISPFVAAGVAGAVVRPRNEDDVVAIVNAARERRIPIVARGASSSGYGGVLPLPGATVVDMNDMNACISLDEELEYATVEAGAVWEDVEYWLNNKGYMLCAYPSSAPSSTVAGWLAQGGSGFGAYRFGGVRDTVVSARVVLPTGEVREFTGSDLRTYVAEAEGTTGIITQVTYKVRKQTPLHVRLISLPDEEALGTMLERIVASAAPIYSISFLNPTSVRLKKTLPPRTCHAFEEAEEEHTAQLAREVPDGYLLLIACDQQDADIVDVVLTKAASEAQGSFLSDETANLEWEERFNTMRLKKIGPSIVPTEVVVPRANLVQTLSDIKRKVHQEFVLEGTITNADEAVLLGYIPHDERRFSFNVAYALSLSVIRIAQGHGGRVYATGLYFRNQANTVFGPERLQALDQFKNEYDAADIMNPGKVFARKNEPGGALDKLMGLAKACEPVIRPFANAAKAKPYDEDEMPTERNNVPGEVAYHALACARCGYCVRTCEQYSGNRWESQSPRGKYALIKEAWQGNETWDRDAINTVMSCTTCERCELRCQLQLPVSHSSMILRGKLVEEEKLGTFPPFEMMAASLENEGDIWAGKREHRDAWLPADVREKIPEKADIMYFAGCTASYVENDIAESTLRLLQDAGYNVTYLGNEESCCGIPMKMAGKWDLFEQIYERNTAAARAHGAKTIVTSCPACALVWKEMYAEVAEKRGETYEFEVKHYSELLSDAVKNNKLDLVRNPFEGKTVTFHDSCHLGRAQGIYQPPRDILQAIPGISYEEMEHHCEDGICCGSVITLVADIDRAPVLGNQRLQEAVDCGADTVVAACPCCQVQLRDSANKNNLPLEIDDLARAVASAAGHDIPKSDANTTYMWGRFDKFIRLMKPEVMAKFMTALFPQMLCAMGPMGRLMPAMAKTKAGAALMEAMMPKLFPKMAPGIMDAVMDDMIDLMAEYMGEMPPDMASMMPDLIPKTMKQLMPTYIPELVPYLVPLFMDYLKEAPRMRDQECGCQRDALPASSAR